MARSVLVAALLLSVASASPSAARTLWEDTVAGTGSGGTADAVVTTGSLVIAGGKIPLGGHTEALLRAYDAASGALRWENQPHVGDGSEAISALAEADGRIFVTVTANRLTTPSSDWVVRAFDAATGSLLWADDRDDGQLDRATGLVAADGRLFVAGRIAADDGTAITVVRAYAAATGALLWEDFDDPGAFRLGESVVAASEGRVFVGSSRPPDSRVRAYDATSGARLWSSQFESGSVARLATATNRLFVSAPAGRTGEVRAYDADSGAVAWQIAIAPPDRPDRGFIYDLALAASDDALYVGTTRVTPESSDLAAYDAATGATLWSREDAGAAWGLTLDHGRLYAATALHGFALNAFDAATGELRWRSSRTEPGRTNAIAARDGIAFAAGFVGPPLQSFHVAAFDGSRRVFLRPIAPRGPRLPITR